MLLFPQIFYTASLNGNFWKCNKIGMLFLFNMNSIMIYWYAILCSSNFFFCLAHKLTNISAESTAGRKPNLITKKNQKELSAYNNEVETVLSQVEVVLFHDRRSNNSQFIQNFSKSL